MLAEMLAAFLARVRPREGWGQWLLALTAVLCLPAVLVSTRQEDGEAARGNLFVLAILAMMLGVRLGRSRVTSRRATVTASLLGAVLTATVVGRLAPPVGLLWREGLALYAWLRDLPASSAQGPPLAELGATIQQQLEILGMRLWWASRGHSSGQATDPVFAELFVALLAWGCAFFAAWQIYRQRRALVGLLPTGVAATIVAFFQGGMPVFYLFSLAFCSLWLAALLRLQREQEAWDTAGTDYPEALGFDMSLVLLPWLVAVLFLAAIWPVVRLPAVRDAFWQRMDEPWSRLETGAERYLGPLDTDTALGGAARGVPPGELPQVHLLGTGPELFEIEVLRVWTGAPPPPMGAAGPQAGARPRRYWRRATFDTYTGLGWINAAQEAEDLGAGALLSARTPGGEELWQRFELLEPSGPWIYAANTPYRLDVPVRAWRRSGGELVGLTADARRYTVLSWVPPQRPHDLEASGVETTTLPAELAGLYLALPDTVPQRVRDLAVRVAGTAPGNYERAQRIEAYLRRFTYTLDLPRPPRSRDLVDWFLFDLQQGYCDYYASAMVVMARAAGLPARLATGYAQGTYDGETGAWTVSALDAHSWPEIHIQGAGWVEFEPTAGQPALERRGQASPPAEPLPPPPQARSWLRNFPWGLVALGALAVFLLAVIARLWRPRVETAAGAAPLVRDRYARLLRWGERLGHPLRGGQTALEYGRDLGRDLGERGQAAHLPQAREGGSQAPAEIERLAAALNEAQYAREPVDDRTGGRVQALWSRLRAWLLWIWIAGRRRRRS